MIAAYSLNEIVISKDNPGAAKLASGRTRDPADVGNVRAEEPEHSEDGVDLTLIRWMLSLTPGERLAVLRDQVDSLLTLRAKFASHVPRNTENPDAAPR